MKTAIFGAGQAGVMTQKWLPAENEILCFIDNNIGRIGRSIDGIPVLSLADALKKSPDMICIAVLNREAGATIRAQVISAGYTGEIRNLEQIRSLQDIRLAALRLLAGTIQARKIEGTVAELGVYKGDFAAEINRLFPERPQYYFDTFSGFDARDLETERQILSDADEEKDAAPHGKRGRSDRQFRDFSDTSMQEVMHRFSHPENVHLVRGYFPDSTAQIPETEYAFVSLDPDLYAPTLAGLQYFWPRLVSGGVILLHDYTSMQFPGVKKAADEFMVPKGLVPVPLMDLHGSAVLVKQVAI